MKTVASTIKRRSIRKSTAREIPQETKHSFHVGILAKDEKITAALVKEFKNEKEVTLIDLVSMSSELFKQFINNNRADIVVTDEETFLDPESREKSDAIIKRSDDTYFVTAYNDENAARMYEINEFFLKNEVPVFPSKVGFKGGHEMLAGNVRGAINIKINIKRRGG